MDLPNGIRSDCSMDSKYGLPIRPNGGENNRMDYLLGLTPFLNDYYYLSLYEYHFIY